MDDGQMEYGVSSEEVSEHSCDEDWEDTQWSTAGGPAMPLDDKYKPGVQQETMAHTVCDKRDAASCGKDTSFQLQKSSQLMSRMQLNDNKAGMEGLDKAVINQIIYEASKGSKFFENEKKKEEQVLQRIQEQEKRRQKITEAELKRGLEEADKLVAQIKANLDLSQTVVHVDMDAFYAAVEMRDNPSLRNKPMAVGGVGMLSTSNYEARKFGVRAAMPGFIGRKLCPQLIIVPPNFSKYTSVSHQIREVFTEYDPGYCPVSLDEAYLNFTSHLKKRQSYSSEQRTFLRRCQSPPDPALCWCDLNVTLLTSILNTKSLRGDIKGVKDRKIGRDSVSLHPETTCCKMDGALEKTEGFSDGAAFSASSHLVPSSAPSPLVFQHLDEAERVLLPEELALVDVASQGFSNASLLNLNDKNHYQMTPSSIEKENTDPWMEMEKDTKTNFPGAGMVCPVCSKKIPTYEVVTFGTDAESAVQEMRCRIEQHTLLTASAGIASNMMLAKVCSDQNKPNGQFFLPPDYNTIMDFVYRLPIRKISGIGRVSEQLLQALGISKCSDLFHQRALLYHLYSPISFKYFMRVACGVGSTHVVRDDDRKSMSTEQTFRELSQPQELYGKCLELCQYLASDLASEGLLGKTVSLKLKTVDFQVRTRAHTISSYTNDVETIFSVAKSILQAEMQAELPKTLRLRLMGVRMAKLISENECPREKQESIMDFLNRAPEKMSKNTKLNAFGDSQVVKSPDNTEYSSNLEESSLSYQIDVVSSESLDKAVCGDDAVVKKVISPAKAKTGESFQVSTFSMKLGGQACGSPVREGKCNHACSDEEIGGQVGISKDAEDHNTYIFETQHDGVIASEEQNIKHGLNAVHDSTLHMQLEDDANCFDADLDICSAKCAKDDNSLVDKVMGCMHNNESITKTSHSAKSQSSRELCGAGESLAMREPWCENLPGGSQFSAENSQETDDFSSQSGCEQARLCPVCFKHVNCINLVDFNDHIDKCLLLGTSQGSSKSKSEEISQSQQQKAKTLTSKRSKKHGTEKRMSLTQKQVTELPRSQPGAACEQSKVGRTSDGVTVRSTAGSARGGESLTGEDPIDYMVCPLCGAERADWTLETFNQHVDTCLNRETISQILQEQKNEEQQRKRPSDSQESEFCSQGTIKRPKKTPPPKNRTSILSFFKSNTS